MEKWTCNGSSLLMVLLILMVMSILAAALINMIVIHIQIGKASDFHQAAYYFAEAGLQNQIEVMANHMELLYSDSSIAYDRNDFYNNMIHTPIKHLSFKPYKDQQVNLKITRDYEGIWNDAIRLTIYSRCTIGNIERTLKAKIEVLWEDPSESDFKLDKTNFRVNQFGETYERDI